MFALVYLSDRDAVPTSVSLYPSLEAAQAAFAPETEEDEDTEFGWVDGWEGTTAVSVYQSNWNALVAVYKVG